MFAVKVAIYNFEKCIDYHKRAQTKIGNPILGKNGNAHYVKVKWTVNNCTNKQKINEIGTE